MSHPSNWYFLCIVHQSCLFVNGLLKFYVSKVILSSDLQYGLLVAECVLILPVVELFWRSVHLPKQDFLGTNRNAGNDFFCYTKQNSHVKNIHQTFANISVEERSPNWTFRCRRQTSLRHLQSSPGCRATPTSNTRCKPFYCWLRNATISDTKETNIKIYMPMCQFMECIGTNIFQFMQDVTNIFIPIYAKCNKYIYPNLSFIFTLKVSVNGVEVRAVKPGVYRHTITGS